jgi:hypothetical protein
MGIFSEDAPIEPKRVKGAVVDLHTIAVEEAYRMVAMYLDRLIWLGENPRAMSANEDGDQHVSVIRGWSRELVLIPENGEWENHVIAAVDRDNDDPTGLHPHINKWRREAEAHEASGDLPF